MFRKVVPNIVEVYRSMPIRSYAKLPVSTYSASILN